MLQVKAHQQIPPSTLINGTQARAGTVCFYLKKLPFECQSMPILLFCLQPKVNPFNALPNIQKGWVITNFIRELQAMKRGEKLGQRMPNSIRLIDSFQEKKDETMFEVIKCNGILPKFSESTCPMSITGMPIISLRVSIIISISKSKYV